MSEPNFTIEHRITGGAELRITLPGVLPFLQLMKAEIMATQLDIAQTVTDVSAKLAALTAQATKVGTETAATLQKVTDLETVIASLGGVDPALQAAVDALKVQAEAALAAVQTVDALVPDAP